MKSQRMLGKTGMFTHPCCRYADHFAATYSIVARDPETGEMGVAVQSHWFAVGTLCPWAEAGVGAIATQAFVNPMFGQRGLELMKQGKSAQETLDELLAQDEGREFRQVALIDVTGHVSAWTGEKCVPAAGHLLGQDFSVQANLMLNETVWSAMAEAFQGTQGHLADRMLAALEAAQEAGGDIRGQQSAAMLIVRKETTGNVWEDRVLDLRIDDHPAPLKELKRLLTLHTAYQHMNAGDQAIEHRDVDRALREYQAAQKLFPENLEMKFWHAVSLANAGRLEDALPIFHAIFAQDNNWRIFTPRLVPLDILTVSEADLDQILAQ